MLCNNIKTDIVLVTCWNSFSLPFIKFLLEHNKRVVIGGVFCNSYESSHIRQSLIEIGLNESLLTNLMIVKGYVDLTTDLYELIDKWEDIEITENDFSTMWHCRSDYIKDGLNIFRAFKQRPIWYTIVFDNSCWYNKCTFCNIDHNKRKNFIKNMEVDELVDALILNLKEYQTNLLFINDPYFIFTPKNKYILGKLKQNGIKIAILTGINLLKNKKYLKNINNYIDELRIGLESCSDFALSYINKGYDWNGVIESINMMRNELSSDVMLRYLYIMDLAETSKESVLQNYNRMIQLREMIEKKFDFAFFPRNLHMFKDIDIQETTKYIRISENSDRVSGIWKVYNHLEKYGFEVNIPEDVVLPYERYDENGKLLPSDYEIITGDMMKEIVQ
jgi:wyosine [tRNA(Phe)-imidazoG37] synthetase (radical SAM superfamily)